MSKQINFTPFREHDKMTDIMPVPASKAIPDWWRKITRYTDGSKEPSLIGGGINHTVKACNPFLDALTAGYMILLERDLFVEKMGNLTAQISWRDGTPEFVAMHSNEQIHSSQIPAGFVKAAYKFSNSYGIRIPQGYSVLVTHPLNRNELPFYTLSGIVDADGYNSPIALPFFLREDFEGIIPAGTPIAQVIPIKREEWGHEFGQYDEQNVRKLHTDNLARYMKYYKDKFWHRKSYK